MLELESIVLNCDLLVKHTCVDGGKLYVAGSALTSCHDLKCHSRKPSFPRDAYCAAVDLKHFVWRMPQCLMLCGARTPAAP